MKEELTKRSLPHFHNQKQNEVILFFVVCDIQIKKKIKFRISNFEETELTTTHYVSTNKIIHVYFSHMTYLMSHVTSLNNTHGWFYKLPHSG